MKLVYTHIFFLLSCAYLFSQSEELFPETEIVFHTTGASTNQTTYFEVLPLEPAYFGDNIKVTTYRRDNSSYNNCNFITQDHTSSSVTITGNVSCAQSGLKYIFANETWLGGNTCNSEYRPFANSIYQIKITSGSNTFKFILDTRHATLPNNACENGCSGNDISIIYFANDNTVGTIHNNWNSSLQPTKFLSQNEYYTWREIRNVNCVDQFSPFNDLFMPILLDPVRVNDSPSIEWIPANNSQSQQDFDGYDLQRSINYGPFISIFRTTDFNTTTFLDEGVYWPVGQTAVTLQYRVIAGYLTGGGVADASNYKRITTSSQTTWKSKTEDLFRYYLSQNYPNPFNNSTIIHYSIPEAGFVTLKIYDILGREVKDLFNGFKDPGSYTINIDASNLSSGTYFYILRAGSFKEIKQMVLLK